MRVDIHDETFVAADPSTLRRAVVDDAVVGRLFPGLATTVFMDRGEQGVRWSVTGEVDGSLEVWLERVPRGTVVHWFVRGRPPRGLGSRAAGRVARRYTDTINAAMFALKDTVEAPVGDRREPSGRHEDQK